MKNGKLMSYLTVKTSLHVFLKKCEYLMDGFKCVLIKLILNDNDFVKLILNDIDFIKLILK